MRHELWIIAHKTKPEIVYALGENTKDAWAVAVQVMFGDGGTRRFDAHKKSMFDNGFRARRCTVEVHSA